MNKVQQKKNKVDSTESAGRKGGNSGKGKEPKDTSRYNGVTSQYETAGAWANAASHLTGKGVAPVEIIRSVTENNKDWDRIVADNANKRGLSEEESKRDLVNLFVDAYMKSSNASREVQERYDEAAKSGKDVDWADVEDQYRSEVYSAAAQQAGL